MNNKILVFGCSGTVGLDFIEVNKNKNILYYSRKKPDTIQKKNWRQIDLDKKIIGLPKKVDKIFLSLLTSKKSSPTVPEQPITKVLFLMWFKFFIF